LLLLCFVYHTAEKLSHYFEYHINMAHREVIFIIIEVN